MIVPLNTFYLVIISLNRFYQMTVPLDTFYREIIFLTFYQYIFSLKFFNHLTFLCLYFILSHIISLLLIYVLVAYQFILFFQRIYWRSSFIWNYLFSSLAPAGRGRGVTRSPSAIKQMLLEWTKAMTQEYSDVSYSLA